MPTETAVADATSLSGFFHLSLNTQTCGACAIRTQERGPRLSPDASAAEVELAIESMSNSGDVLVSRLALQPPGPGFPGLYEWQVTFLTLIGDETLSTGGNVTIGGVPLLGVHTEQLVGAASDNSTLINNATAFGRVVGVRPAGYCAASEQESFELYPAGTPVECVSVDASATGTEPSTTSIAGLIPGTQYFGRAMAKHSLGFGSVEYTAPRGVAPPK